MRCENGQHEGSLLVLSCLGRGSRHYGAIWDGGSGLCSPCKHRLLPQLFQIWAASGARRLPAVAMKITAGMPMVSP